MQATPQKSICGFIKLETFIEISSIVCEQVYLVSQVDDAYVVVGCHRAALIYRTVFIICGLQN